MTEKLHLACNILFLVPPDEVVITGPTEVGVDQDYVYRCEAKNANPAPQIQWVVNGQVTTNGVSTNTHPPPPQPSGFVPHFHPTGWKVTSDFALKIMEEDQDISISCKAISRGHYGDSMIGEDQIQLTVLSKFC